VKKADIMPYHKDETVLLAGNAIAEPTIIETSPSFSPSPMESKLLSIKTFNALNSYINQWRRDGIILHLGSYKSLPSSGLSYIFIHNPEGEIRAHIKYENEVAINMCTGIEDAISNYKGCGAIWIQLKQQ
jgi:hypothetical protein